MKDETKKYSRRDFISTYFYAGSVLFGGGILFSCTSLKSVATDVPDSGPEQTAKSGNDAVKSGQDTVKAKSPQEPAQASAQQTHPCDDLTGVSPEEIEKRKKLAYVNKTPIPDSHCSNCALYIPPGKDKQCGGCMLFKGPVRAEGYCAYWAPVAN